MSENFSPASDAAEQLRRWDAGDSIWSIEVGGIGPGYEQAIQLLAIEIVRDELGKLLADKPPSKWGDRTVARVNAACGGFSGHQVGAAKSLAFQWLTIGPAALLKEVASERRIQVSSYWPLIPKAAEVK